MARRWVERDHPRHPGGSEQGGQFRERVGSGSWASRLAGMIGKGRTRGVRSRNVAPWEGGARDDEGHFQRDWEFKVNALVRERGLEPDEIIGEDGIDEHYEQYQVDPAGLVDYLMEQQGLPGGRSDLVDVGEIEPRAGTFIGNVPETHGNARPMAEPTAEQRRMDEGGNLPRLTNQEVAQMLAPQRDHAMHDAYNSEVIGEAEAVHAQNVEDGEVDSELSAQIHRVMTLSARGDHSALDEAVDHLRRMLTLSYMDEDELPPLPSGRRSGTSGI